MTKIEIGLIITIFLAIISGAKFIGELSGRLKGVENSASIVNNKKENIAEMEKIKEDVIGIVHKLSNRKWYAENEKKELLQKNQKLQQKNNLNYPIIVSVTSDARGESSCHVSIAVEGHTVTESRNNNLKSNTTCNAFITIPPNTNYKITSHPHMASPIITWYEFR